MHDCSCDRCPGQCAQTGRLADAVIWPAVSCTAANLLTSSTASAVTLCAGTRRCTSTSATWAGTPSCHSWPAARTEGGATSGSEEEGGTTTAAGGQRALRAAIACDAQDSVASHDPCMPSRADMHVRLLDHSLLTAGFSVLRDRSHLASAASPSRRCSTSSMQACTSFLMPE